MRNALENTIYFKEKFVEVNDFDLDSPQDKLFETYERNESCMFFFPMDLKELCKKKLD